MRRLVKLFDDRMIRKIRGLPVWVRPFMRAATFLGEPVFTIGAGVLLVGIGWGGANEPLLSSGFIVVITVLTGGILKLVLRRKRPLTYVARWRFSTFSFPSGHTVGATAAYGALAILAGGAAAGLVAICFALLAFLVGVSRVYLGAHYPSDVVAGWLLGSAGLLAVISVQPVLY